jgi:hypothetical protein
MAKSGSELSNVYMFTLQRLLRAMTTANIRIVNL